MNETVSLETREVRFLSVFDFDGTLTYRDSFVPFLRFAFGNRVFVRRMLRMAGPSLAYLCRRIGRDDLKARLIATFLTDVPVHVLEERALAYQNRFWETLMRPHALTAVADQVSEKQVIDYLQQWLGKRTLVITTHKKSMLALVERAVVLRQGRVIMDGPLEQVVQGNQVQAPQAAEGGNHGL